MMRKCNTSTTLVCLLFPVSAWAANQFPTVATQTLLEAHSGLRAMAAGEGMSALYGVPFATDDDGQTTTDDFVAAFLGESENRDALGVDDLELEFVNKITIRNGKFTVYTYVQKIEDLPVHGSSLPGQPSADFRPSRPQA